MKIAIKDIKVGERRPFTAETKAAVWDKTEGRCSYCGKSLNPFRDFTIDHVMPFSLGGSNEVSNLVPSCRECNASKGTSLDGETANRRKDKGDLSRVFWTAEDYEEMVMFYLEQGLGHYQAAQDLVYECEYRWKHVIQIPDWT